MTTLNRWDPIRDLLNFQEKMSRLFEARPGESAARRLVRWCPAVDVLETPEAYIFRAELPGVGRENISIELRGHLLVLAGERLVEPEPRIAAYHSIERVHGFFERTFSLPGGVDVENARARYVDGVLEVLLPKADEREERTIAVVCSS